MRRDDLREFVAIPVVVGLLGTLALILFAATQGLWVWLAVGVLVLVGLAVVALVGMAKPHHPPALSAPSRPDHATPSRDDGVHRVLVIADEACATDQLGPALAEHGPVERTAVFVVAPALGSRTARWTGGERPHEDAARHLEATLQALAELHIEASGHVGSHDPLQAADDGLREFAADEIVFAVHPEDDANWLERGVVEAARARYPLPVTALTVTRS